MNRRLISFLMVAIGAGLVGCNGDIEEPIEPEPAAPQEQPQAPDPATPPAQTESRARPMEALPPPPPDADGRTTASPARDTTAAPAEPAPPRQRRATATPPSQQQAAQPGAPATPVAGTPQEKARLLLDQLFSQIGENKWGEAEKTLAELQKLKSSVPPDMRDEIDNARASFQAAKQISNQDR